MNKILANCISLGIGLGAIGVAFQAQAAASTPSQAARTSFSLSQDDRLTGSTSRAFNSLEYDTLAGGSGWDIFVLGESAGNYYQGAGYALITDYNGANDYIRIKSGSLSLSYANWGVGSSALDTAIYQSGDLIGVVQDNTSIALTSY